ncbi:hypothetical protein COCSUDRAFT_41714 [Coccomyxa subellipsoidea C-169]|uniref:Phosphoglycerate mutase-like protein n=1 Tax=Coccomyxa subellipsoidea (strain C-169) TaxID=574566 RepID=I0YYK6_COCSC|nr:hypothetical protein COCSUDRAFT_41714 [Coccomyxa subellipsoidea C-169]EIE23475.1 hypothetical protein COCSUDRAFT_41714 [Coccomyxa subellipsoidea C-169]|eukprot:XP_005648019.1 hypothetical protein COCSUDRAFT_41714 [Coccomyxa subellipsoidea C-169]
MGGAFCVAEDDFKISYSQSYTRNETQPEQQERSPSKDDPSEMFFPEESRSGADEAGPSRQLQSAPARNSLTPELVLHIIRHGESEFNAATNAGHDFKDPQIFNPKLTSKGRRQVAVRHELTEHLVTTGDIGLPISYLAEKFDQLREAMSGIPERWWFAPECNDSLSQRFNKIEPKRNLQERVASFRRWVQAQQEQVIVAYGHSSMIRELSGGKRLKNCEILTLHL